MPSLREAIRTISKAHKAAQGEAHQVFAEEFARYLDQTWAPRATAVYRRQARAKGVAKTVFPYINITVGKKQSSVRISARSSSRHFWPVERGARIWPKRRGYLRLPGEDNTLPEVVRERHRIDKERLKMVRINKGHSYWLMIDIDPDRKRIKGERGKLMYVLSKYSQIPGPLTNRPSLLGTEKFFSSEVDTLLERLRDQSPQYMQAFLRKQRISQSRGRESVNLRIGV